MSGTAACAVLVLVAVLLIAWRRASAIRRETWLPRELQRAELAYAERLFRSVRPPLVARVDRAYRRDSRIVLLELKTRAQHRTHAADIIELSAQRLAIEAHTGEEVDSRGYVLTALRAGGSRKVHRITLMDRGQVQRLIERRDRILDGRDEARYASHRGVCRHCSFLEECRRSR